MKATYEVKQETHGSTGEYPCLKISDKGRIVLFTKPKEGVQLNDAECAGEFGSYSDVWAEYAFKPYCGQVVISQK